MVLQQGHNVKAEKMRVMALGGVLEVAQRKSEASPLEMQIYHTATE